MKYYTVNNSTLSISAWAKRAGVSRQAMASRVRKASTDEEISKALTAPPEQGCRTDIKQTAKA